MSDRDRDALVLLQGLRRGDSVVLVTGTGERLDMTVRRAAHPEDNGHGSWQSTGVTLTMGPGLWSERVDVHDIASGLYRIETVA